MTFKKKLSLGLLLIISCTCDKATENGRNLAQPNLTRQLYILINDLSGSANYLELPAEEVYELVEVNTDSIYIQFIGITVTEESWKQTAFVGQELVLELEEEKGNFYQINQAKEKNKNKRKAYEHQSSEEMRLLIQYLQQERNAPLTDLEGALLEARKFINQAHYANYNIKLIVLSDMKHEHHDRPLTAPVEFNRPVEVYIIGKTTNIDLDKILKDQGSIEELAVFRAEYFNKKNL